MNPAQVSGRRQRFLTDSGHLRQARLRLGTCAAFEVQCLSFNRSGA